MANVFSCQGNYDEALDWYRRAHIGREKSLGKNSRHCPLHGKCALPPGKVRRGTELVQASTFREREVPGQGLSKYAHHCPSNGNCVLPPGKVRRALAGEEESLGKGHPDTALTVNGMANVFQRLGKNDKALELFRRTLAGREKSLGKGHPDTLATGQRIAAILREHMLE